MMRILLLASTDPPRFRLIERLPMNESLMKILTLCRLIAFRLILGLFTHIQYLPSTCQLGWTGLCKFNKTTHLYYLLNTLDILD